MSKDDICDVHAVSALVSLCIIEELNPHEAPLTRRVVYHCLRLKLSLLTPEVSSLTPDPG